MLPLLAHHRNEAASLSSQIGLTEDRLWKPDFAPLLEQSARDEARRVLADYSVAQRNAETLRGNVLRLTDNVQRVADRLLRRQRVLTFYASVLDKITENYVTEIETTLNRVFVFVFNNPNKRIALEMTDRYNKKVLVPRIYNMVEGKEYPESLKETGKSVSVVLGTVLLVYFIMYTNTERVILFDEAISGLSVETSARFFELLQSFRTKLNFRFGIISHEIRYEEFVDHVYTVRRGVFVKTR